MILYSPNCIPLHTCLTLKKASTQSHKKKEKKLSHTESQLTGVPVTVNFGFIYSFIILLDKTQLGESSVFINANLLYNLDLGSKIVY